MILPSFFYTSKRDFFTYFCYILISSKGEKLIMATKTYEQMTEDFRNAFKDYKLGEQYNWTNSGKTERNGEIEEFFSWKSDEKEDTFVSVFLTKNGDIHVDSGFGKGDHDTNITPYNTEPQFDCVKTFINTLLFLFLD
jgi:hypothetical protein